MIASTELLDTFGLHCHVDGARLAFPKQTLLHFPDSPLQIGPTDMAEDTDFAALYRELGIDPTCTLAELRNAYRRRVSELHPDLRRGVQDTGRLQRLNRLQGAAIDFHRQHGRLPGAPDGSSTRKINAHDDTDAAALPTSTGVISQDAPSHHIPDETNPAEFGRLPGYFVAASVITIGMLAWHIANFGDAPSQQQIDAREIVPERTFGSLAAVFIVTGMGKDAVQQIQGEPLAMHAIRWDYGPSWVEFRCDHVVDWYSSPLRPLHTHDPHAPPLPALLKDARCK